MKLCVPINQIKFKDVLSNLRKAQKEADIIEIWFDRIDDLNVDKLISISSKPILYKVTKLNFGVIDNLLSEIKNISHIDFDLATDQKIIQRIKNKFPNLKVIISQHDFKKTPDQNKLSTLIETMFLHGADIAKIATQANKLEDSINMLSTLSHFTKNDKRTICLCMGKHGYLTRVTGHLFGNYLMYAPINKKDSTAPGQITLKELKKIIKTN